jgi:hypothetical protein
MVEIPAVVVVVAIAVEKRENMLERVIDVVQ